MRTMTSAEFRKTYARLSEPVIVTANGHIIGQWEPRPRRTTAEMIADNKRRVPAKDFPDWVLGDGTFTQQFTPAPKPSHK